MDRVTLRLLLAGWMFLSGLVALAQTVGDSPETVVARLGEPTLKRTAEGREIWVYPGGKKLTFVQNRLAEIETNAREAAAAAAQAKRTQARERTAERTKDRFVLGPINVPSVAVIVGLAAVAIASFAGLNRLPGSNHKAGIAAFAFVFVLNTALIALTWYDASQFLSQIDHPRVGAAITLITRIELLRFALVCLMMFFMWRGSGWAFGIFCLLGVPSILLGLFVAYKLQIWGSLLPGLCNAWMIALLVTTPVQGFLDRKSRTVAETIREMDQRNFAASKAKR